MNRFSSPASLFRDAAESCRKLRASCDNCQVNFLALLKEALPGLEHPISAVSFSTESPASCGLVLGGR